MTIIPAILACLAVKATLAVQLKCPDRITCPCGSKGKNVTVCAPAIAYAEVCARLSNCEACEDGIPFCTKCPEGSEGPSCSRVIRKSRKKRRRPISLTDLLDFQHPDRETKPIPKATCKDPGFIANGFRRLRNGSDSSTQENFRAFQSVVYECTNSEEFRLQGSSVLTCGEDGDWSSARPECIQYTGPRNCPYPEKPKNGRIRCFPKEDITSCTGYCFMGYSFKKSEMEYAMTLNCTAESGWTPRTSFPDCQFFSSAVDFCQDPGMAENGSREPETPPTPRGFPHGSGMEYSCNQGYQLRGESSIFCLTSGEWTGIPPRCEALSPDPVFSPGVQFCQDPGMAENGSREPETPPTFRGFPHGSRLEYSCNQGYQLRGDSSIFCLTSGEWIGIPPRCEALSPDPVFSPAVEFCQDPGMDENGSREPEMPPTPRGFPQGSRLEYSCKQGYQLSGESSIFCLTSGKWTGFPPRCEALSPDPEPEGDYCENPGIISNGRVVYYPPNGNRRLLTQLDEPEFPEGGRLEYSCDTGHMLLGRATLICEKPGFWSEDPPICRRDTSRRRYCMYPGNVLNGQVEHFPVLNQGRRRRPSNRDREEYAEGSRLQYSCEDGYTPVGPTTLTCKSTGSWSPAVPPTCANADDNDRVYCENPGRVLNGKAWYFAPGVRNGQGVKLESEMEEYPEGSSLEFYCDKGFWLQGSRSLMCDSEGFWSAGRPTCVGDCGRTFVQSSVRIRDGQETMTGEWPWVVSISLQEVNSSRFICGGAVFNTRTVVTAAHCLKVDRTYILRFGKYRFRIEDDDSEVLERTSSRVIIHPDYSRKTLDSDIGLILFQQPIEYSVRVQPICMPTIETTVRNIMKGRVGYVSGWGDTELELPSESLLFAGLPVLSMRTCVESYMRQNLTVAITGNMFCAGYYNGTYSVCGGDSGSPFVFYDNLSKRFTLEGLVSFVVRRRQDAQACGLPGRFAIFTRVFRFVPWMYENIE